MKANQTFVITAGLLAMIISSFACIGIPDEGDTQWLDDAVGALPPDKVVRIVDQARSAKMCEELMLLLNAQGAFRYNNPLNQASALVAVCHDENEVYKDDIHQVRTRSEIEAACRLYPGVGDFAMWWRTHWRNVTRQEWNETGSYLQCRSTGDWKEAVDAVQETNRPKNEPAQKVLVAMILGGLTVLPAVLEAEGATELLLLLARYCTQSTELAIYCDAGPQPAPIPTVPPGPLEPAPGDAP